MKKIIILIYSLLVLFACYRENDTDLSGNSFSIIASMESSDKGTKTMVQEGGPHVFWEPGDEISVFYNSQSGRFSTGITEPASVATFTGTMDGDIITDGSELWALYPYSSDAEFRSDQKMIVTVIPSEQVARAESFGKDINVTVAHSTSQSFTFYNVGGGVRVSFEQPGIKKAILKSLGGESIAGEITIDASGDTPVVSSVNNGQSSITLIPPDGESFQTDTWYYFVTIPGTLSEGYSVFYCTDSNSGKLISNNSVTIKRSIYGSVEHVDKRAEQQEPAYAFPSTEEEWNASLDLANTIAANIDDILHRYGYYDGNTELDDFLPSIGAIDGVKKVYATDNEEFIVVSQEDGLCYNVLFKLPDDNNSDNMIRKKALSSNNNTKDIVSTNSKKKALLLLPFSLAPYWGTTIFRTINVDPEKIASYLELCDCTLEVHYNEDTNEYWGADTLSKYDLILIATHGSCKACNIYGSNDGQVELETRMNPRFLPFDEIKDWSERIKLLVWQGYLHNTVSADYYNKHYKNIQYNGSIVYAMACHSFDSGDLKDYFIGHGCSAYCGIENTVSITSMDEGVEIFVDYLSKGASVAEAFNIVRLFKEGTGDSVPLKVSDNPSPQNIYLVNPKPSDLSDSVSTSADQITLSWTMPRTAGTYNYNIFLSDGTTQQKIEGIETTSFSFYLDEPGTYTWYVESYLLDDNYTFAPHPSETATFTIDSVPDEEVPVTAISLDKSTLELAVEETATLTATVSPSNATQKDVIWSSSNTSVATVSTGGVVTAVNAGTATITATTLDGGFTATCSVTVTPRPSNTENGHEWVDLGLPSGLKWATCNVGATAPEEYGDYFAWGDPEPYYSSQWPLTWKDGKSGYSWSSYQWCNGSIKTLTKYNYDSSYGTIDNNTVLDPEDDAAHVNWGGSWRMPTDTEWTELRTECTWTWTTQYSKYGRLVIGPNGNSIFLPAAGYRRGSDHRDTAYYGYYWSSSLYTDGPRYAFSVYFYWDNAPLRYIDDRCFGFSVRPVTK